MKKVNYEVVNFSDAIKYMRTTAGFTQKYLAEVLNIPHQTFSSYERGYSKVNVEMFNKIAVACEFEVNMTITDINSNKKTVIKLNKK